MKNSSSVAYFLWFDVAIRVLVFTHRTELLETYAQNSNCFLNVLFEFVRSLFFFCLVCCFIAAVALQNNTLIAAFKHKLNMTNNHTHVESLIHRSCREFILIA